MSNDFNEVIRAHAMLVSVHIKHWSAGTKDNEASRAAALSSGAEGAGAYHTVKNLMFKNDTLLKDVQKAGTAMRNAHNDMTMAWDVGRSPFRMLPTTSFGEYMKTMGKYKREYDDALAKFTEQYPADAAKARAALNMPDDAQTRRLYPGAEELAQRFGVTIEFEPIAEGQKFQNITESAATALSQKFEERVARRYSEALESAYGKLAEMMETLRENLATPIEDDKSQKWRDSSLFNVTSSCATLRGFDLFGNSDHEVFCNAVENKLGHITKKQLSMLRKPDEGDARQELIDLVAELEIKLEHLRETD